MLKQSHHHTLMQCSNTRYSHAHDITTNWVIAITHPMLRWKDHQHEVAREKMQLISQDPVSEQSIYWIEKKTVWDLEERLIYTPYPQSERGDAIIIHIVGPDHALCPEMLWKPALWVWFLVCEYCLFSTDCPQNGYLYIYWVTWIQKRTWLLWNSVYSALHILT